MYVMYDTTTLDQVPAGPHAVACYIDGKYKNDQEARSRFPHAQILTISTGGGTLADCYDIERGDYKAEDVVALYDTALAGLVWRPCFYADLSNMPAVIGELDAAGIRRQDVRLWVAAWDGITHVPSPYDAKQFTNRALGRNLDESVLLDTFFRVPGPNEADWMEAKVGVNKKTGEWRHIPLPAERT